jgi:ribokinase
MIVVIGSTNIDTVIRVSRFPSSGETVKALSLKRNLGGKGANQAVSSSRLGSKTLFINAIGNDTNGELASRIISKERIITRTFCSEHNTGEAFIEVDETGTNKIIINAGANDEISINYVSSLSSLILKASVILIQGEIPWKTNEYIINHFSSYAPIILDPAPPNVDMLKNLHKVKYITPNETEFKELSGLDIRKNNKNFLSNVRSFQRSIKTNLILKMGNKGCYFVSEEDFVHIPAIKVNKVVDTTGAGDCFNGAFAYGLDSCKKLFDALNLAVAASSICVTRSGAVSSFPNINDTLKVLKNHKKEMMYSFERIKD